MQLVVLPEKTYWDLRKPYDMYLPVSVSADDVEAELDVIQTRFSESVAHLGAEDDAWEFPGHYQHVRVFYMYLYSPTIYTPDLAAAIHRALEGFDEWICELECYSIPGDGADGGMRTPVYLKGRFYTEAADAPDAFASCIGARSPKAEQPWLALGAAQSLRWLNGFAAWGAAGWISAGGGSLRRMGRAFGRSGSLDSRI